MHCTIHTEVASTGRCRRCHRLMCSSCGQDDRRRPVCLDCRKKGGRERRGGVPLIVILVVPPILAPILVMYYDELSGARKRRNEAGVMETLRSISRSQAMFREQDRDNDNILDYATNLAELEKAGLIDSRMTDGVLRGYSFGLRGSTFDWLATATPVRKIWGNRHFSICTDGVIRVNRSGWETCTHIGYQ